MGRYHPMDSDNSVVYIARKEQTMSRCYACGEPIRRGYPMITNKGEEVIICERCKRLWKKAKAEEEKIKGVDDK